MVRTRKDFFTLAIGIASFIVGLVLIGNYIPQNWIGGGIGIGLVILGVYLTGIVVAEKPKQ